MLGCHCRHCDDQADIQVPADSIKFMVWELRQTYAAHTACACIIGIGVPADFIMAEAFCQNSHIKLRIMGNQETAAHDGLDSVPDFGESGLVRNHFRCYASQRYVEIIKSGLRIDQRVKLVSNFPIFNYSNTDRTYTIISQVRRFYINHDKPVLLSASGTLRSVSDRSRQ